MPDPALILRPETIETLRLALVEQRASGPEPTETLSAAIRMAAREGFERNLPAEAVLIQLKSLADDVGLDPLPSGSGSRRHVREWMITACLRAYWDTKPPASR